MFRLDRITEFLEMLYDYLSLESMSKSYFYTWAEGSVISAVL